MAAVKKFSSWYQVSFAGGLVIALYALVPPYIVYADSIGLLTDTSRLSAMGGMSAISLVMYYARKKGHALFHRKRKQRSTGNGFTLMELLVVISIIGIMASLALPVLGNARQAAYFARAIAEFRSIATALELYSNATGIAYPADANRGLPPGVEAYLSSGDWPQAPWPGSIYDWDVWSPGELSHPPYAQVRQISVRFCPLNEPTQCNFPEEDWAANFDYHSSVYYCVSGPCRAHSSKPSTHPGYCVNC